MLIADVEHLTVRRQGEHPRGMELGGAADAVVESLEPWPGDHGALQAGDGGDGAYLPLIIIMTQPTGAS